MKSNASLVYGLVLVVGDFLALIAGFATAYAIRGPLSDVPVANPIPVTEYIDIFLLLLPFWILIFGLLGLYGNTIQEQRFRELGRLLVGAFIGLLFVVGYGYITDKLIFPARLVPVYGFILAFVFLVIFRNLAREARAYLYRYDIGITNVLIVGNTKVARELVENLADRRVSGYRIVGVIGNKVHTSEHFSHIPVFEDFEQAVKKLNPNEVHSIVQTELYASQDRNNQLLEFAQTHHIAYRFIPGNSEMFVGNIEVELFRSQLPVISVHQTPLFGWGRFVKRTFDLLLGGLLLVIASPFMLAIAAINVFAGGGVFFRQVRLTRFNQEFKVYKFRTQYKKYDGTTPEQAFAMMGKPEMAKEYRQNGDYLNKDPRVTPFGRFLRKTSLDELPQLFNVVKGDLSLVGPRALIPEELSIYEKKHAILSVKSGLTGLAQVSGRRSIDFNERRQLDVFYVQNWSFWLDLVILIKT
ncbi:MAG TPA: sugar transferase, partial [Candidatus Saccharimonadales bacterium]|nr:sugar transferase [Candidatus Saccharimonadales bacterium]